MRGERKHTIYNIQYYYYPDAIKELQKQKCVQTLLYKRLLVQLLSKGIMETQASFRLKALTVKWDNFVIPTYCY